MSPNPPSLESVSKHEWSGQVCTRTHQTGVDLRGAMAGWRGCPNSLLGHTVTSHHSRSREPVSRLNYDVISLPLPRYDATRHPATARGTLDLYGIFIETSSRKSTSGSSQPHSKSNRLFIFSYYYVDRCFSVMYII